MVEEEREERAQRAPIIRGDGFDAGQSREASVLGPEQENQLAVLFQNPSQLAKLLDVNESQVQNIKSAAIGLGTGYIHNKLSPYFGDDIAAAVGAFGTSYILRKLTKLIEGK